MATGQEAEGGLFRRSASSPKALVLVGRGEQEENGDICGDYIYIGLHQGKAAYRKRASKTVIRWVPAGHRWIVDRHGLQDSDVCVAYADCEPNMEADHPGIPELVWRIWTNQDQAHVPDVGVICVDAPRVVTMMGRSPTRDNHEANGEYVLAQVIHGLPAYVHKSGHALVHYDQPSRRWLLKSTQEMGNNCSAFAEAGSTRHPAHAFLEWVFYEAVRRSFTADPAAKMVQAPAILHVIGRKPSAENARINGSFYLVGLHNGMPLYVQPGTQTVIRYDTPHNWWLIDCEGLAQPSILDRLHQWILSGDGSAASSRCTAYAEARGTDHPGYATLEWHVWETQCGKHVSDPAVRTTTAPLIVQLRGRGHRAENGDIDGDYNLVGSYHGRPAYQKAGAQMFIRYHMPFDRWLVDKDLCNTDTCIAWADAHGMEHPASADLAWHVYTTARASHLLDQKVKVSPSRNAPAAFPSTAPPTSMDKAKVAINGSIDAQARGSKVADAAGEASSGFVGYGRKRWLSLFGA